MRADIHDGPEHMLQSEAGYIDARPLTPARQNLLQRTAGPYIGVKLRKTQYEQMLSGLPTPDIGSNGGKTPSAWDVTPSPYAARPSLVREKENGPSAGCALRPSCLSLSSTGCRRSAAASVARRSHS